MPKIVIMIPTYNEKENIINLITRLVNLEKVLGYPLMILVVDDNSPDKTWELVHHHFKESYNVTVLRRMSDKGRGKAGVEGYKWALENNADIIIELDADMSHNPIYIPKMINILNHADVVLGSRRVKGGMDVGRPWWRRTITILANIYIRSFFWININDCNSGFRAFRREAMEKINPDKIMAKGPDIIQEVLYRAHLSKLKIVEIPIVFKEREKGESSLTFMKLLSGYIIVIKLKILHLFGWL